MSIVGVTASYIDYAGPYASWAVFTIHVAALKKNNHCSEDNTPNINLLIPKTLLFQQA